MPCFLACNIGTMLIMEVHNEGISDPYVESEDLESEREEELEEE